VTFQPLAKVAAPVLLLGCLLALTCSQRPNWGAPPAPRVWPRVEEVNLPEFTGAVETALTAQKGTLAVVSGWAASHVKGVRVVRTEMMVDGVVVAGSSDLVARDDIAKKYNRRFEESGWRYVLSAKNLKPGEHELRLRVIGSDGLSAVVFSKPLTILQ